MSYAPSTVAFIDTETTGLDPERHHIWEYAVIVDGSEYSWQARWPCGPTHDNDGPDWSVVDPWMLANTGIRERFRPSDSLHPIAAAERFANLTEGRHLVGACPWFDSERVHRVLLGWHGWGGHYGRSLPWHYHLIDVEALIVGYVTANERGWELDDPTGNVIRTDDVHQTLPWNSRELSRLVHVDPDKYEAHTALGDARWAKACFEAVMGDPQ